MSIKIDETNLKSGLLGLVVALVEIIKDVLEREALRRMERGSLNVEELDRLGNGLLELNQALDQIQQDNEIENIVERIRSDLDTFVDDTFKVITQPEKLVEQ